jgi:hypothetical protein
MADDDPKKNRFKTRRDRDDDDDDLPRSRRRDEEEREPPRVGSDRPPVLFLVGLIVGALSVTTCCGLSGWWTYATVVRGGSGGGGGWSLFGSNDVEIVSASRAPGFGGFNASPQVSWKAVGLRNVPVSPNTYFLVMKCGPHTHQMPYPSPTKGMDVTMTVTVPEFRNVSGPIEIWVERRTNPNQSGSRVSNKYTVP